MSEIKYSELAARLGGFTNADSVDGYHVERIASYTPALTATTTNPTLGSGSSQYGRYCAFGQYVDVEIIIKFGTSGVSAGSGTYLVSLPTNADGATIYQNVGYGYVYDASAGITWAVVAQINNTDASKVRLVWSGGLIVNNAAPMTWSTSDQINLILRYRKA